MCVQVKEVEGARSLLNIWHMAKLSPFPTFYKAPLRQTNTFGGRIAQWRAAAPGLILGVAEFIQIQYFQDLFTVHCLENGHSWLVSGKLVLQ